MKTTNAIDIRRSLGKLLTRLAKGGEPILVERAGKEAAVLVSIADFRERFADGVASEERRKLVAEILGDRPRTKPHVNAVTEVRRLRGKLP